jgi:uncharacterized protein (TIGR03083 family)
MTGKATRAAQREMLRAERADLRQLLSVLTPEQWDAPSLCAGWRVRDVVAHLVATPQTRLRHVLRGVPGMVHFEAGMNRTAATRLAELAPLTTEQLLDAYDTSMRLDRPYDDLSGMPWFGRLYVQCTPDQGLADTVIHHQDIRVPLGLHRVVPPQRVLASLNKVAASRWVFGGKARTKGLRIEADDIDFASGNGALVRGPGEALALALSGRSVGLDRLEGEGVPTLRSRIRSSVSE